MRQLCLLYLRVNYLLSPLALLSSFQVLSSTTEIKHINTILYMYNMCHLQTYVHSTYFNTAGIMTRLHAAERGVYNFVIKMTG